MHPPDGATALIAVIGSTKIHSLGYLYVIMPVGVGAKTIRALSLIPELVYGVAPSYRDPARYSFAHGGKDGIPYPVDRKTYDQSIELLRKAINKAKLGIKEKNEAVRRLEHLKD